MATERPEKIFRAEVVHAPPNERLSVDKHTFDREEYERWRVLAKTAEGYPPEQGTITTRFFEGNILWEERP